MFRERSFYMQLMQPAYTRSGLERNIKHKSSH
nr:MAG TPA_asm: hypothetical protein [Caudoviricetes sp.]